MKLAKFKAYRELSVLPVVLALVIPQFVSAQVSPDSIAYLKAHSSDAWSIMALAAVGQATDATPLKNFSGSSATDYEKEILGLLAAGQNPTSWEGRNLAKEFLDNHYKSNQIGDPNLLNDDAWGILALKGLKNVNYSDARLDQAITDSRNFLLANQQSSGGWGSAKSGAADSNDTAAVLMALVETGSNSGEAFVQKALNFMQNLQLLDGGIAFSQGYTSDGASDAWVIALLNKIGVSADSWKRAGAVASLKDHLILLKNIDGSFSWQSGTPSNPAVTSYAVLALSGQSYPVVKTTSLTLPSTFGPSNNPSNSGPIQMPGAPSQGGGYTAYLTVQPTPPSSNIAPFPPVQTQPSGPSALYLRNMGLSQPAKSDVPVNANGQSAADLAAQAEKLLNSSDYDRDGLNYAQELIHGTDPNKADTDNDGHSDGYEVSNGYDPLNQAPCKKGANPNYPFAYGQHRLKTPSMERCFADYLAKQLKGYGKVKNWNEAVNAFIYGGYSISDIRLWLRGKNTVDLKLPKWQFKMKK